MNHRFIVFAAGVIVLTLGVRAASANADLVITSTDVSVAQSQQQNTTTVTVVVHNNGDAGCGPFDLRVGVSGNNTSGWGDHRIAGILAGGTATRVVTFNGTNWKCGWARADQKNEINENSENNNYYSQNTIWIVIPAHHTLNDVIGAFNMEEYTKHLSFAYYSPPDWNVSFDPPELMIEPLQTAEIMVTYEAPPTFQGHAPLTLVGRFDDGVPGELTWDVHAFMQPTVADRVICEPLGLGGGGKDHPPIYWYDVTPGDIGRCDFHVQVMDPIAADYTEPTLPAPTWQFAVHQVGGAWYASWWDPQCQNAIFDTFRFQFRNEHAKTWSHWTTTIDGGSDPYVGIIDVSVAHADEADGVGYRVHAPGACTGQEKIGKATCKQRNGLNTLTVKLAKGVPGDAYFIELDNGQSAEGTLNTRGKASEKFVYMPPGSGTVSASWGCGTEAQRGFTCP